MTIKKVLDELGQVVDALQGEETNSSTYSSEHIYPDEQSAAQAFLRSKEKLFDVNSWSQLEGVTSAFTVYNQAGKPRADAPLQVGDYIRIQLPGPLPENWVRVTAIETTETAAQFMVSPSENPQPKTAEDTQPIEHFFGPEASSTFRVEQQGRRLVAMEIGQHERINNQEPTAGNRAVVNTLIAAGGWAFFQEMQWKKLTDYLTHH